MQKAQIQEEMLFHEGIKKVNKELQRERDQAKVQADILKLSSYELQFWRKEHKKA